MVSRYVDLLSSLPKPKRNVQERAAGKDPEVIRISRQYGFDYFDGDRKFGYGGFKYDGRWRSVARDIIKHFDLKPGNRVLDIGCGKGFLVKDLMQEGKTLDVYGVDISQYAIENCEPEIEYRLYLGNAEKLIFKDRSFDAVVSINTLHNLPREKLIIALKEIERVSCGKSYIVVDSYHTPEQKKLFESWVLTAEYHGYPHEWQEVFDEAGYTGDYSWTIIE